MSISKKTQLTHISPDGKSQMVDVSSKTRTRRTATASAKLHSKPEVIEAIHNGRLPKGDALATARIAGISAAKKTSDLIPLCHNLPLDWAEISFEKNSPTTIRVTATVTTTARTGVEMEAITAATIATLTLYDMGKAIDKGITIGPIQLERKDGGKSGLYIRNGENKD